MAPTRKRTSLRAKSASKANNNTNTRAAKCADFAAFPAVTPDARAAARQSLDIPVQASVAAYLGSIGTWARSE